MAGPTLGLPERDLGMSINEAGDDEVLAAAAEVCRPCRFGTGPRRDCVLISAGQLDRLLEEGPCDLGSRLLEVARDILVARGRPAGRAEDRRDALLATLSERQAILARLGMSRLDEFEVWLRGQLAAVIDEDLVEEPEPVAPERVASSPAARSTGLRCGSCRHLRRGGRRVCGLEFIGSDASDLRPNPWWGRSLAGDTDPGSLQPPCPAHEPWAAGELDPFDGLVGSKPAASRRDEAARLVCLALDRFAGRDELSLGAAALLRAQVFQRRELVDLAAERGLGHDEALRLVAFARDGLARILAEELGLEPGDGR